MRKSVSLIELVVVISIVGILAAGFSAYYTGSVDLWDRLSFRNEVVGGIRSGIARMGRDIRQIKRWEPTDQAIETATGDTLQFLKFDEANTTRMRYRYVTGDVYLQIDEDSDGSFEAGEPSSVLIEGLSNFTFSYFDSGGNSTAAAAEVYRVRVDLDVQRAGQSFDLQYDIFPRNFKQ